MLGSVLKVSSALVVVVCCAAEIVGCPHVHSVVWQTSQAPVGLVGTLVLLLSVSNATGRLVYGLLSDRLAARVHRAWFVVVASSSIGFLFLVLWRRNSVMIHWIAAPVVGFSYGGAETATWP